MKKIGVLLLSFMLFSTFLIGCGKDPEITRFKKDFDTFCTKLAELDSSINSIEPESITATRDLLNYLDEVEEQFKILAEMSVPDEFSYLSPYMIEARDYMSEAVSTYHDAYNNNSYNEYTAAYAYENYARAYKRVQYIITVLRGDSLENDETKEN